MNDFKVGDLVKNNQSDCVGLVVRHEVVERLCNYWCRYEGRDNMTYFQMNAIIVRWPDGTEDDFIQSDLTLLEKINESR